MTILEGAKVPTDHLPAVQPEPPVELTLGWELMKPLDSFPAWDLFDFYAELTDLWEGMESATGQAATFRAMGGLTKKMLDMAVDADAYTAFASGPDGVNNAVNLAGAWMAQLGKSVGSGS